MKLKLLFFILIQFYSIVPNIVVSNNDYIITAVSNKVSVWNIKYLERRRANAVASITDSFWSYANYNLDVSVPDNKAELKNEIVSISITPDNKYFIIMSKDEVKVLNLETTGLLANLIIK